MSLKCRRTIGLRVIPPPDMPLDAAVYVSSESAIYGVRGGKVLKFNSDTGALISMSQWSRLCYGKSSICYVPNDPLGGVIYCAAWQDPARTAASNAGAIYYDNLKIRRISPANALTVLGTHDVYTAGPGWAPNAWESGVYEMMYHNANLYLVASKGSSATGMIRLDPTLYPAVGSYAEEYTATYYTGPEITDLVPYGGYIWIYVRDYQYINSHDPTTLSDILTPYVSTGTYDVIGFCYAAGFFWGGLYVQSVVKVDAADVLPVATVNVEVSACAVHRVRYDSANNLIYTANSYANSVSWFAPPSPANVYYKTGFDYPVDIVFTGAKAFAVQAGSTALKEIDITAPTGTV